MDVLSWSILRTASLKVQAKESFLKIATDLVKLFSTLKRKFTYGQRALQLYTGTREVHSRVPVQVAY